MTQAVSVPPAGVAARPSRANPIDRGGGRAGWGFLAPFGVFYLLFLLGPAVVMLVVSLFNSSLVSPGLGPFAGFGNYAEMFGRADFWDAMWHTVQFTIYTTPPLVILGFVLAVLTNRIRRGQWFFRLAFFLPFVLPSATISLIWLFIFTPGTGLWALGEQLIGLTPGPGVLAGPGTAMIGVALATVWWTLGFNFVLYLAGLQEIPRELYEAASLDGATGLRAFRSITWPLLRPVVSVVLMLGFIYTIRVLDIVLALTGGGPADATQTYATQAYSLSFTQFKFGTGAALSNVLIVVSLLVAALQIRSNRRQSDLAG